MPYLAVLKMKYGICPLSIVPVRREASDTSEQVTQLLFGETYRILRETKKWVRIETAFDRYEGWIDAKQSRDISEEEYSQLNEHPNIVTTDLVDVVIHEESNRMMPIVMGSTLPDYQDGRLTLAGERYRYEGAISSTDSPKEQLVENAFMYLRAPYLWGGRSPFGIDCSGFTQLVYKMNGFRLYRDASQQATQGEVLSFIEETEPGDLAFFDNAEGVITHVGIILEENRIIHASGQVRVDRLNQQGIFNAEVRTHTHKLRLIKKVI